MLKQRVITAVVLLAILLPALFAPHAAAQAPLELQGVAREHAADRGVVTIDDHLDRAAVALADLVGEVRRQPGAPATSGSKHR